MAEKEMTLREKLRAKTLGAKKTFKTETVEFDGEQFEIRQPSVAQRAAILQAAKAQLGDAEKVDVAKLQVWATICCTYVPGEEAPVFTEKDVDDLMKLPSGSFVDEFSSVALKLMNVEAAEAAKNSDLTANVKPSSV